MFYRLGIKKAEREVIAKYYAKLNVGILANQQLKTSLLISERTLRKTKTRVEEVNNIVEYLDGYVGNSWAKITKRNARVQTFTGTYKSLGIFFTWCVLICNQITGVLLEKTETISKKLETTVEGVEEYVKSHIDTLSHVSWPYELNEEADMVFTEEAQGLDTDNV